MKRISIYGETGSYSEQAALQYFGGGKIGLRYCKFLPEVFESVESESDFGVVPIENSIEGAVTQTYDLLLQSDLSIIGEDIVRISHCLMAQRGVKLANLKFVYSHQQALAQCRDYIERHRLESVPFYDTAGSAKMLAGSRIRDAAAIASARAAKIYGLNVLARDIQSNRHNYTRFLIISKSGDVDNPDKTAITFSAKNKSGSLFTALNAFAHNKVNLLYIQSRPIPGTPWEYNFYIDCDSGIWEKKMRDAVKELCESSDFVKVLGSYKRARFDRHA
ncbi:MAG: prephenate dehydratase [Candidatus Marsarchaeota archaeon]|nr:prephenate dehydratase [Candidatus Marsarchaeota archaeon]MCL5413269.1 prephenate dehydratase [Candidatus Marsarchaeota archaeon]